MRNEKVLLNNKTPLLFIVVDTEEEFEWTKPFSRLNTSTRSIKSQVLAQEIYEEFDVVPTYVLDYCVATDPEAIAFLKTLRDYGACEIGAHLHPWVTPPYLEEVNQKNSFHGNLPEPLERLKIQMLTRAIEDAFKIKPRIFKAGRYGIGPSTLNILQEEGYMVDCSYVPYTSFHHIGGPSFLKVPDQPFWIDEEKTFLEVPLTKYFFGSFAKMGPFLQWVFDLPVAKSMHIPGLLGKIGINRSVLSPEGVSFDEHKRLIKSMLAHEKWVFCLTYHSTSLAVGNTPYVQTKEQLNNFISCIRNILKYFRYEVDGQFITISQLYNHLKHGEFKDSTEKLG